MFEIHAPEIFEMFISKHKEKIEYAKKYLTHLIRKTQILRVIRVKDGKNFQGTFNAFTWI